MADPASEPPAFDVAAYIDAASAAIALPIPDACRAGTAANLTRLRDFAALLVDFEPALDVDLAPVFRVLPVEE